MGTRGLLAFHESGVTKAAYTHWDAYPGGLGADVLDFAREQDLTALRAAVKTLVLVEPNTRPTPEQIEVLSVFGNGNVSSGEPTEWYVLLRETQGKPSAILEAGYVLNAFDFGYDSLFCEWAFVVDLDAGTLDAYRGFNQSGTADGLWASGVEEARNEYGPVTKAGSWPLTDLPTTESFVRQLEDGADA